MKPSSDIQRYFQAPMMKITIGSKSSATLTKSATCTPLGFWVSGCDVTVIGRVIALAVSELLCKRNETFLELLVVLIAPSIVQVRASRTRRRVGPGSRS